ncbi:MAG: hypothetical protein Ta2A_25320 [Treponemataceae bacterium]|nr:MAG: hypothetical protein Ta2A_25320 [Treponemataceae bacterium]
MSCGKIPATGARNAKNALPENVLVIAEQGAFAVGGTVATSEGVFDPMQPWFIPQGGQTRHGDHADVFYQVPYDVQGLPLVFLHGYGQSRRSWETTADGREGFSNIFLRKGYPIYLIDQPGRGSDLNNLEVAENMAIWLEEKFGEKSGDKLR